MTDNELAGYGADVCTERAIRRHLPKAVAAKLIATMRDSRPLDPTIADAVAEGMIALKRASGRIPRFDRNERSNRRASVFAYSTSFSAICRSRCSGKRRN